MFVVYAKELMEAFRAEAEALGEQIREELKPLGIDLGPKVRLHSQWLHLLRLY